MKNLFDFATKELSQDAFLRWLLENFDNPIIGKASAKLLNAFMKLDNSVVYRLDSIKSITTLSQYKHIDIIVDVELHNGYKFIFIIEDKTSSLPHDNQLNEYAKTLKDRKCNHIYKIYYKTDCIFKTELEEIQRSNWLLFDIGKINSVFEEFINSDDEILSFYANNVNKKYKTSVSIPVISPTLWSFEEWAAYFKLKIAKIIEEKFNDKLEIYAKIYRGKLISLRFYHENSFYNKHRPCIEFCFNNSSDTIRPKIHIETKKADNTYTWKLEEVNKDLIKLVKDKYDIGDSKYFKKFNGVETIATIINPFYKSDGIDFIESKIIEITSEFNDFFNDTKLRINNPTS